MGVPWDLGVGNFADAASAERVAKLLAANPALSAVAGLVSTSQPAQIGGHSVPIIAFQPHKGMVSPTVVEGREPLRPTRSPSAHSPCGPSARDSTTR
jgi:hypothetical protein